MEAHGEAKPRVASLSRRFSHPSPEQDYPVSLETSFHSAKEPVTNLFSFSGTPRVGVCTRSRLEVWDLVSAKVSGPLHYDDEEESDSIMVYRSLVCLMQLVFELAATETFFSSVATSSGSVIGLASECLANQNQVTRCGKFSFARWYLLR